MKKKKTMSLILALALILTTVLALPTATYAEGNNKIERVDVTIKAPICGTWIAKYAYEVDDYYQDHAPIISLLPNAPYQLSTEKKFGKWMQSGKADSAYFHSPLDGAMKGGNDYFVRLKLLPKEGYEFSLSDVNTYINGRYYGGIQYSKDALYWSAPVTAVHDWQAATTTKPKTCKACGATVGKPIGKATNPLKIKAKTAIVKYSKLKKKNQTLAVGKVISFTKKGQGKITYAKVSGNKKITVNKKTGKVTVKKGLKKGTYKVKAKVKAEGNSKYKPITRTVTFKIKVR